MAELNEVQYKSEQVETPEGHDEAMVKLVDEANKLPEDPAIKDNIEIPPKPEGIPDKFYDAETGKVNYDALAKSYTELEKKQSQGNKDAEPEIKEEVTESTAEEVVQQAGLNMEELSSEYDQNGSLTDKSYEALEKAGIPKATVDNYIAGQAALVAQAQEHAFGITGGKDNYQAMSEYGKANLSPEALASYNTAVNSPNQQTRELAIRGLYAQYTADSGSGSNLVMGKGSVTKGSGYDSRAQMLADMQKPEYASDPAFRDKVAQKIAVSNI